MRTRTPKKPVVNGPAREIAAKVQFLFDNCLNPSTGKPFTYMEVEELTKDTDSPISNTWLSKMGRGLISDPGLDLLSALARFLKVDPSFWFRPFDEELQAEILVQKGSPTLQKITLRASELESEDQHFLLEMAESLKRRRIGTEDVSQENAG